MKKNSRVVMVRGPHAGRHGTIVLVAGENPTFDTYLGLEPGMFRVGLDGLPGNGMVGGAGGVSINVSSADITAED